MYAKGMLWRGDLRKSVPPSFYLTWIAQISLRIMEMPTLDTVITTNSSQVIIQITDYDPI